MEIGRLSLRIIVLIICGVNAVLGAKYAVLTAETPHKKGSFCIQYFPQFSSLPTQESEAKFYLAERTSIDYCDTTTWDYHPQNVVLLSPSNCSLVKQARVLQESGAVGVLFITKGNEDIEFDKISSTEGVNITVGLINERSASELETWYDATVGMFAPQGPSFDLSLLVIWIVSMFTVIVGGYWSGKVRHSLFIREIYKAPSSEGNSNISERVEGNEDSQPSQHSRPSEESSLGVTPCLVAVFVLFMGATLLLLYFFFDYLVYFLIGLFVLATINSTYVCTYPMLRKILPYYNLYQFQYRGKIRSFHYIQILSLIVAISLPVTWVATRHDRYAWILQDILGVMFCINMLRTIRLPNFKVCAFLLVLLFFYDIFFVFITPFLTAKGESVMEEVAIGRKSEEKLPMVLRVPHFTWDALTVCYTQFSVLGFGDILVPGLLIAYCHGFDLITGSGRIYFITVVIAYGLGMIITFTGLLMMEIAQPALLYLVPATVIPTMLLAWKRKEISAIWNGVKKEKIKENGVHINASENDPENFESVETINGNQPSLSDSTALSVSDSLNHGNNEQKLLIP